MLEVIGAGNPDYSGQDWAEVWANSSECKQRYNEIEEIVKSRREKAADHETKDDREYAMPLRTQVVASTKRTFVSYWRTPDYAVVSWGKTSNLIMH